MSGDDQKKISLTGTVLKTNLGGTSKSARQGFVLQSGSKQIVLRRQGGNPMYDNFFEQFENTNVKADGFDMEQYFLVTNVQKISSTDSKNKK